MSRQEKTQRDRCAHRAIPASADTKRQEPPPPMLLGTCLMIGVIAVVISVLAIYVIAFLIDNMAPTLSRARETARRASCQNNLKQLGIVCHMYAGEQGDCFPPLSAEPGRFCFNPGTVYPHYMNDYAIMLCPSDPVLPDRPTTPPSQIIDDHSYFYLGYAMTNEDEARAFLDAYARQVEKGGDFQDDLPVAPGTGTGGADRIVRLRESPESFFADSPEAPAPPAKSAIPVMFDREPHHPPGDINVLYMDGHVEFLPMESRFPAQQWFLDALAALESPPQSLDAHPK